MDDYKQWLDKAKNDLQWTKHNIDGCIWYGACFTAQQAAEKAFKGYIIYHSKKLRKIHDLRVLLTICAEINERFEKIREEAILLNSYYTDTRYPGFDDFGSFTKSQANEAYAAAKEIVDFVKKRIDFEVVDNKNEDTEDNSLSL